MTRPHANGPPVQKQPRGQSVDHSPDDRRHAHPAREPGMDADRRAEKHHHKR